MVLTRDDLELTLKELRSQRVQFEIQLLTISAAIKDVEERLKVKK